MFYDKLHESKDVAATVLQKNVYENYNEFVTISKEIQISFIDRDGIFSLVLLPYVRFVFKFAFFSVILKLYDQYFIQLESDMLVLRSFLNELRNVSDNLREDSTVDSVTTDSGK